MKEQYNLSTDSLPTIPVPHDCVIKTIIIDKDRQCISFVFEDDISVHDSIADTHPGAKSLIIKYHFYSDIEDYELNKKMKPTLFLRNGGYKCLTDYEKGKHEELLKLTKYNLEYLYHYVAYQAIIIVLWAKTEIVLKLEVDTIEYEWLY